jgi:hypothetical protein
MLPLSLISPTYIARLDPIRLVFSVRTQGGDEIVVKFGYGKYEYAAHEAAAKSGLAPALLSYSLLAGRMWMASQINTRWPSPRPSGRSTN